MTQKIVINSCFGGFSLSPEATLELYRRAPHLVDAHPPSKYFGDPYGDEKKGERHARSVATWVAYLRDKDSSSMFLDVYTPDLSLILYARDTRRDAPELVNLVEEWGSEKVSGACAALRVVEIPDGVEWRVEEYDGNEHVAEAHRTWG